jgi:hypothetical protein
MSTLAKVYQLIRKTKLGELFTTRHCLSFGSRGAVDQALYCLVKDGYIVRVARGVFMKKGSPQPTVLAVATIKAKSFGKRIAMHGSDAARALGFPVPANESPVFAVSGRSSSFRFGKIVIKFQGQSLRKLHGGNTLTGKVIRALWHLGKAAVNSELIGQTYHNWGKCCLQLKEAAGLLPAWMNEQFYWARTAGRNNRRVLVYTPGVDFSRMFPEFTELFDRFK